MADYYPLISRAVAGLEKNTGEARRTLYERARTALVDQLRGASPSLSESDITRERLALEEAIRKVEAESARRMRFETPKPDTATPPRPNESNGRRRDERERGRERENDRARNGERNRDNDRARDLDREGNGDQDRGNGTPRRDRNPATSAVARGNDQPNGRSEAPRGSARERPPERPSDRPPDRPPDRPTDRPSDRPSVTDEGLKGFRDVVAEAERLGGAAAMASRSARRTFQAVPSPSPEFDRMEPRVETEGVRPTTRQNQNQNPNSSLNQSPLATTPSPMLLEPAVNFDDARPATPRSSRPPIPSLPEDQEDEGPSLLAAYGGYVRIGIAAVIVLAFGLTLFWQRQTIADAGRIIASMFQSAPSTQPPVRDAAPARLKIPDRILPGGQQPSPNTQAALPGGQPAAPVAQRVVLYEEDANDTAGQRFVGSAIWRTETVTPAPGMSPEIAVRADVEIPERRLAVTWSLRRNTDQALPASHTIEIMFTIPADFPHGGISNVPGLLMKQAEQTRGVPLSGLAVKVTTGFFLIGLSAVESDVQRNMQLLKERSWFDIPIVYADGKRAILAIEKGTPGERAFATAFSTWVSKK